MLPAVNGEFRLGSDPELRFTPGGVAVCDVRAVATSRKKVDGEWVDDKECWLTLVGFKEQAENMAESFEKGNAVVVMGRLQMETWEDKEGGKRTTFKVLIDAIGPATRWNPARTIKLDRKDSGSSRSSGSGSSEGGQDDPWAAPKQDYEPPF